MQAPHARRDDAREPEVERSSSGPRLSRPTNPWSDEVQIRLAQLNARRLRPVLAEELGFEDVVADAELRVMETHWIDADRRVIAPLVADVPSSPSGLVDEIEAQARRWARPWASMRSWLAREATLRDVRWIVGQERGIEVFVAGFDCVAQLGLPRAVQHAFVARRERALRSETPMARLASTLAVADDDPLVAEALALANLLAGLSYNRRFAFQAVGALVAQALAADDPTLDLARVIRRAGGSFPSSAIDVDADDRRAWARSAIGALLHEHPTSARAVAEGSVLRLRAGARRWQRYERFLRVGT